MIETKERSSSEELILSEDAVVTMPVTNTPVPPKKESRFRRKRSRFLPFLGIYALILCLVCVGLLIGFANYLTEYEARTPNKALNEYIEWIKNKNFDAIYTAAGFSETVFNGKQDYLQYFERIYAGSPDEIILRERPTTDQNSKQYSVYFDDKRVDIVNLIPRQDDSGWIVVPQLTYHSDCVVYAAPEIRITVNEQELSLLGITGTAKQTDIFNGLHDSEYYPAVHAYTLSGFLNPPSIEALTLSGEVCKVVTDPKKPNTLLVIAPSSDEKRAEQERLGIEAAFTYAKFIARDAGRNTLLKLIYKKSELYDSIRNFSNAWFSKHDSYEFKNVRVHDIVQFTQEDFSCEVEFEPYYTTEEKTYKGEPVHYRIVFLKNEEQWQIISLTPVADHNTSTTTDNSQATTTSTTQ